MKYGVQLFGALRHHTGNPLAVLKQLKEWGFVRVEPCITQKEIPMWKHNIWTVEKFRTLIEPIRAMGLEVVSCHIFAEKPLEFLPELCRLAKEYGIRYFVAKSPAELTKESLRTAALTYMQMADALNEAGVELLIHNEGTDIAAKVDGKTAYEYLIDQCLGKVGMQADVGWVWYGGEDPEAFLWRNISRVKSVHYKDYIESDGKLIEAALGSGKVDITACYQFARAFALPQFADVDNYPNGQEADLTASIALLKSLSQARPNSVSYLNTLDVDTGEVRTLHKFDKVIEAPNWLKNSEKILFNSEGRIWLYDIASDSCEMIDSGSCDNCNNDHVVSSDETLLAVSHSPRTAGWQSQVYILPIGGGEPRLITPNSPSYLHGWSPDQKMLAYCAFRMHEGKREVDVYAIPADGGEEVRLTNGGFNDGPEYSPDGQYIWFNSTRTGLMQAWRMKADGSEQTQMSFGERNNWFPHISPDGKRVVYLSYEKDALEAQEHLPNMRVELYLMNADGSEPRKLLSMFGGQGSINVNSWAKDSRHIAFVSYEILHK